MQAHAAGAERTNTLVPRLPPCKFGAHEASAMFFDLSSAQGATQQRKGRTVEMVVEGLRVCHTRPAFRTCVCQTCVCQAYSSAPYTLLVEHRHVVKSVATAQICKQLS